MRLSRDLGRSAASVAIALALTALAHAQVTPIAAPFVGNAFEDFESFPNLFTTNPLANPTSILQGTARLIGTRNAVYEPGVFAIWGLEDNGLAQVFDGAKGLGMNDGGFSNDAGITFLGSATEFGGYFGNPNRPGFDGLTIRFFDLADNEFYSEGWNDVTGTGVLSWHGWSSTTPIKRIAFDGESPVADSLRATVSAFNAPEPGALSLLALGLFGGLTARRRTGLP